MIQRKVVREVLIFAGERCQMEIGSLADIYI